jgi:hypothetical protein
MLPLRTGMGDGKANALACHKALFKPLGINVTTVGFIRFLGADQYGSRLIDSVLFQSNNFNPIIDLPCYQLVRSSPSWLFTDRRGALSEKI